MPVQECRTPVSLIDIYSTLDALCHLPPPDTHPLDGVDLSPILAGRTGDRGKPVLSTYGQGNHSLRDERFRYIRYRNGAEELYDHREDPYEWRNLANDERYATAKAALARWLPLVNAPDIAKPLPALKHATWEDAAFEP
jgi:arylsulfatase A-like enzyme